MIDRKEPPRDRTRETSTWWGGCQRSHGCAKNDVPSGFMSHGVISYTLDRTGFSDPRFPAVGVLDVWVVPYLPSIFVGSVFLFLEHPTRGI